MLRTVTKTCNDGRNEWVVCVNWSCSAETINTQSQIKYSNQCVTVIPMKLHKNINEMCLLLVCHVNTSLGSWSLYTEWISGLHTHTRARARGKNKYSKQRNRWHGIFLLLLGDTVSFQHWSPLFMGIFLISLALQSDSRNGLLSCREKFSSSYPCSITDLCRRDNSSSSSSSWPYSLILLDATIWFQHRPPILQKEISSSWCYSQLEDWSLVLQRFAKFLLRQAAELLGCRTRPTKHLSLPS